MEKTIDKDCIKDIPKFITERPEEIGTIIWHSIFDYADTICEYSTIPYG